MANLKFVHKNMAVPRLVCKKYGEMISLPKSGFACLTPRISISILILKTPSPTRSKNLLSTFWGRVV